MEPEEHTVESSSGEYSRKVWLLRGAAEKQQKLCVFLDGELYLRRMDTLSILSHLQASGAISPVTCLFVSHVGDAARHRDYTCNSRYSHFIAEDLLRWVHGQGPGIAESDHLICGLSLSGLASAYLALTCPHRFSRALSQSGSFWWNGEWLTKNAIRSAATRGRFWISVGDKETDAGLSHPPTGMRQEVSQIAAVEAAASELTAVDAVVRYHKFSGGHELALWQQELPSALRWLLGRSHG